MASLISLINKYGGLIQTGPFGSQLKQSEYSDDGVPVVMPKDIYDGKIDSTLVARVPENKAQTLSRHYLKAGTILFPRRGDIAKCALITEREEGYLCGTGCIKIEPPKGHIDPTFLYYFLTQSKITEWLEKNAIGSTMLNLNTQIIGRIDIPDISFNAQLDISNVLKDYDDLIENNRRRIQLLEESARLLYKEWFVHLRFPGHEHVKIVDGVPEGWVTLSVKECCQVISYGYTASASEDNVGPKFLRITDIVPSSIDWERVPFCAANESTKVKYKLDEGDIVVARTGATVGYAKRVPKLDFDVVYASYLVRFKPDPKIIDDLLLGIYMESNDFKNYVVSNSGGSAQPNANAQVLGSATLLVPSRNMQSLFRDSVKANFLQKQVLEKQISSLIKARDLLLPRLMNGELTL